MRTTTYLIVAIEHDKDLPEKDLCVADVVADRIYGWLFAKGVSVDVRATRLSPDAVQRQAWEQPA